MARAYFSWIMDDHHVSGDPFYARPATLEQRVAGPKQPPRVVANESTVPALTVRTPAAAEPTEAPSEPLLGAVPPPPEPRHVPRSQLYAMRLTDLQAYARTLGLDDTGKRPVLIARIKAHGDSAEATLAGEPDVVDP